LGEIVGKLKISLNPTKVKDSFKGMLMSEYIKVSGFSR
jgi:hypothetical protein